MLTLKVLGFTTPDNNIYITEQQRNPYYKRNEEKLLWNGELKLDVPNDNYLYFSTFYNLKNKLKGEVYLEGNVPKWWNEDFNSNTIENIIDYPYLKNQGSKFLEECGNDEDTVKYLNQYHGSLNYQDIYGNTGLIFAARWGNYNVVKRLVEYGMDINHQNTIGNNALMLAAYYGHYKILRLLVDYDADLYLENNEKKNVLTGLSMGRSFIYKYLLGIMG